MVEWRHTSNLVSYPEALKRMEEQVHSIFQGKAQEQVWCLEHPPLYTAGTSANPEDLIDSHKFPVYATGRGGQFTYHGPGQRVAYVMIDLTKRKKDIKAYISALEEWIIETLRPLGVKGERRAERVGIWVATPQGDKKIAAIGVRLRKWVTYHGVAINVCPDLHHFAGIVPCGLPQFGVTSLHQLGIRVSLKEIDHLLQRAWQQNLFLTLPS